MEKRHSAPKLEASTHFWGGKLFEGPGMFHAQAFWELPCNRRGEAAQNSRAREKQVFVVLLAPLFAPVEPQMLTDLPEPLLRSPPKLQIPNRDSPIGFNAGLTFIFTHLVAWPSINHLQNCMRENPVNPGAKSHTAN